MIEIRVLPNELGLGISPEGNPLISALDKMSNILATIEISPDAWPQFVTNCGRLRGAGVIPATPPSAIVTPGAMNGLRTDRKD